jgi:hypothetical protein
MNYLYDNLLDPDLYFDRPKVAQFLEFLQEPEVKTLSHEKADTLTREMMPLDDINSLIEPLAVNAQQQVIQTGSVSPKFSAFIRRDYKVKLELDDQIPKTTPKIRSFLSAGKALALMRSAQCIFFSTMQPLDNGSPAFGSIISDSAPWGILVIGSSLRGNCFVILMEVSRQNEDRVCFKTIHQKILREGKYDYPYSRFFHIADEDEMANIVEQIPKLMARCKLSEQECVLNFATSLNALRMCGYDRLIS